jgi:hypothetical protein
MKEFYKLSKNKDHLFDMDFDISIVSFEGSNKLGGKFQFVDEIHMPGNLFFSANFDTIPQIDYPISDPIIPVMSYKMLNVLKEVGEFTYIDYPLILVDDTNLKPFDKNGNLNKDVKINNEYAAIQITKFSDFFDRDKSEYDKHPFIPDAVGPISKLVLRKPKEGFPPLFRIEECTNHLFVSKEAKFALEENKITGCDFDFYPSWDCSIE